MAGPRVSPWSPIWNRFREDRLAVGGAIFIVLLVVVALLAPLLPIRDPNHGYYELLPANGAPLAPGGTFLLGSDPNGRDLLSRIIWGSRTALFIGFVARSEEHTSELQSRQYLVCRLLLEKKKKTT